MRFLAYALGLAVIIAMFFLFTAPANGPARPDPGHSLQHGRQC